MTRDFRALSLRSFSAREAIVEDSLLGAVTYSSSSHFRHPASFGSVPMSVLPNDGEVHQAWYANEPFTTGEFGNLHYRYNANVLFGFITLNEADFLLINQVSPLQQASNAAYTAIFDAIKQAGFTYLVRCWNYLPRINIADAGLERYRHFNIGRQEAFISAQRSHLAGSPSACALGTTEGSLSIYFLASHAEPWAIENPRQMSAYHYPNQYGPSSPTFSRAALLPLPGMEVLFISGTASILGHESLHHDDVAAQTVETLGNIEIVVAQANLKSTLGGFSTRNLYMKVFLRHAEDRETVSCILRDRLGDNVETTWLQADICRTELMVEIEAFGFCDGVTE